MGKVKRKIWFIAGLLIALMLCVSCAKKSDAEQNDVTSQTGTDSEKGQNETTKETEAQENTTAQEESTRQENTTAQETTSKSEQETTVPANENTGAVVVSDGDSTYAVHGKLHLDGTTLTDEHGEAYQIKGVSTHGIGWFPQYVNQDTFADLDSWGADAVRLAMYTAEGGYCEGGDDNKEKLKQLIDTGVQADTNL